MNKANLEPRRKAAVDIKLLRLELFPRGRTPCEEISHEWSPAQPTENLSPEAAAALLRIEIWAPQSVVREISQVTNALSSGAVSRTAHAVEASIRITFRTSCSFELVLAKWFDSNHDFGGCQS